MTAAARPGEPTVADGAVRALGSVSARERRTIATGAAICAIALSLTFGVAPFVRRWSEREDLLAARRERLARIQALVRDEPLLARTVEARARLLAARPRRPLGARSAALAASALQSLMQDYAARSRVQISRVDVAGTSDSAATAPNGSPNTLAAIPATVAALGDVYGLADLLALIERGPRLLEITDLAIQSARGGRGEALLQFSITLRVPYAPLEVP